MELQYGWMMPAVVVGIDKGACESWSDFGVDEGC